MVVGLLGILKAGAAYVPLDLDYPVERLAFMLEDAAAVCVLTTRQAAERLPQGHSRLLLLDEEETLRGLAASAVHDPKDSDRRSPLTPHNPAYVIYTSGSTGTPKGTIIQHSNAVSFLHWAGETFANELSSVLASTSICFDLSIFELFSPLCFGGTVIVSWNIIEAIGT